jgi:ATP-dependent exoDNAse (exonuclease V) alpha subunit
VRGGWNTGEPIGREFAFERGKLNDEQRKAFAHIVASRDLVMDVSGIAGAGKSRLLKQVQEAAVSVGKSVAILSPTDASVKHLRKTGFRARTFQGFQLRPESADLLVIDEASMLSVPQMLWLVKHARENRSRVLLAGDSAQHRRQASPDGVTAVNADGGAGDKIGSPGRQKDSGSDAFIGITKTAGWRASNDFLVQQRWG